MAANRLTTEQRREAWLASPAHERLKEAAARRWADYVPKPKPVGPGRGFRANREAAIEGRANGTHTRVVGPLRAWEGFGRIVDSLADLYRDGELELLDDELDTLSEPESADAIELRALLGIRSHVTRGRSVPLPGSRRDRQARYAKLHGE